MVIHQITIIYTFIHIYYIALCYTKLLTQWCGVCVHIISRHNFMKYVK